MTVPFDTMDVFSTGASHNPQQASRPCDMTWISNSFGFGGTNASLVFARA